MVSHRRRQRANIKKTFFEKLMNIQYLNLPPYPKRWMVWLIQQGLAWRPRCVKTCCQEDGFTKQVMKCYAVPGTWPPPNDYTRIHPWTATRYTSLSSEHTYRSVRTVTYGNLKLCLQLPSQHTMWFQCWFKVGQTWLKMDKTKSEKWSRVASAHTVRVS